MASSNPLEFAPFHEALKVLAHKRAQLNPANDIHPRAYNEFTIRDMSEAQARAVIDIIGCAHTMASVHKLAGMAQQEARSGKPQPVPFDKQSIKFFDVAFGAARSGGGYEKVWDNTYSFAYDPDSHTATFKLPVNDLQLADLERVIKWVPENLQQHAQHVVIKDHPELHGEYMVNHMGQLHMPPAYEVLLGGRHTHIHAEILDLMLSAAARGQGLTPTNGISEDFPVSDHQVCDLVLVRPQQYETLLTAERKAQQARGK